MQNQIKAVTLAGIFFAIHFSIERINYIDINHTMRMHFLRLLRSIDVIYLSARINTSAEYIDTPL